MYRFKRVLMLSAFSLGFVAVSLPARATAQQVDTAAKVAQDSAAKDSVKKAKAAECTKANQAMNAMIMKKMQEQRSQPKDSTQPKGKSGQMTMTLGPGDLPPGVTMQTLMRCMQGGARPPRHPASPKSATPSDSGKADSAKGKAP